MESANKAIMMAFGMLVAVMIIGMIVFVFSNLKVFPQGDDQKESVEQIAAFNLEYEVYDKKIMYGVDVISVLNKAKSNNEKYVQEKFLSGLGYNTDYIIDIEVRIKSSLSEKIEVTYLEVTEEGMKEQIYAKELRTIGLTDVFKKPSAEYRSKIWTSPIHWNNKNLGPHMYPTQIGSNGSEHKEYHLLGGESSSIIPGKYTNAMLNEESKLKALLEFSTTMKQVVKNPDDNKMMVKDEDGQFDAYNSGWNQAIWYPAIYQFKTLKFKSLGEEIVYSEKTGRIIKMVFEEI